MDLNRQAYPMRLTPSAGDSPDFDYGAFLRDDAMDFSGAASASASSTTLDDAADKLDGSPTLQAAAGTSSSTELVRTTPQPTQRQRLERRGHTKSRRGCFNCKRRRIKCQETRPACGHCMKTGLKCEYPALPQIIHQPHHQIPLFSLQDMRFFQHFLLKCYPTHPLGNEGVWTHEVPCLSQTHEYLMHALLGLSASDLMQQDPSLLPFAMTHRLKAIKSIKKRLTEISRSTEVTSDESNAMVATCFALTFQSVMLDDGMAEFMTFIRGILIVGMQMWMKGINPMFSNLVDEDVESTLGPFMAHLPLIQREWADAATAAIQGLRALCREEVEIEYHDILMDWVQKLYVSSFDAYKTLRRHYGWWMMLPHDKFRRIIDPTSQVMVLLSAHWIALKQIMAFITECEEMPKQKNTNAPPGSARSDGSIDPGMIRWLKWLNRQVDAEHQIYNTWPLWVEEQLDRDIRFFGKTR